MVVQVPSVAIVEQWIWLLPHQDGLVRIDQKRKKDPQKSIFLSGYYYNIAICDFDPAEDNYEDFCNLPSTR